ncbi:DUF4252 domain-containing protein [Polaribacter sp. KT 15]|uniref:DUF4252 domain-containing protein n=1 Tax=Polaribacter sp. KT 15 TaxID=1896175 RepID=UPI00090C789D|nr:DUF4252 domain-containing protein [Polaribacter sp. KT 15]SHN07873.1 protein of unknown function [Polaribacter sp. KT 15]
MKKLTTILSLLFVLVFASSCKNDKSLQSYLVDTSGKEDFYTGDLPVSSLLTANSDVSDDVKETMKSIKKINVAFLPKTADNSVAYETEKGKLKKIFTNNDTYKNLMSMKTKGMNVKVYYSGDTNSIDEVIAFGYGKEAGVGVARLLGENMNPSKIIDMLNSVNVDGDSTSLKQFSKMFNK